MKDKIVTITSKHQITLPAEYVRKMNLTRNRRLRVIERHGSLELRPEPAVEEIMAPIWAKMKQQLQGKKPLTHKELRQATRDTYAAAGAQEHRW